MSGSGPPTTKSGTRQRISQSSVGRSDSLPVGLIPPPILESINGLLDKLGYVQVDESWGTADSPGSLLLSADEDTDTEPEHGSPLPEAEVVAGRLKAALAQVDAGMAARWGAQMTETFAVVIRQPHSAPWEWNVDLSTREISSGSRAAADPADSAGANGTGEDDRRRRRTGASSGPPRRG